MKEPRRLALKREALTALATTDLENVVGGHAITYKSCTLTGTGGDTNSLRCQWTFNTCETCYC